jgi:hypothetical protein
MAATTMSDRASESTSLGITPVRTSRSIRSCNATFMRSRVLTTTARYRPPPLFGFFAILRQDRRRDLRLFIRRATRTPGARLFPSRAIGLITL